MLEFWHPSPTAKVQPPSGYWVRLVRRGVAQSIPSLNYRAEQGQVTKVGTLYDANDFLSQLDKLCDGTSKAVQREWCGKPHLERPN